jgi:hypothetical protein
MSGRRILIRMLALLMIVGVVACGSSGGSRGRGGSTTPPPNSGASKDLKTVTAGRTYVDGKVTVTSVDLTRIAQGVAAIKVRNKTSEFLSDLSYEITLYYPNRSPDPAERSAMPFTAKTTKKKPLDLDVNDEVTLHVKQGELGPGATNVQLRLRADKPTATREGAMFLGDRIKVVGIKRGWFETPPTVKFTIQNVWDSPLRLLFKVLLIKDGKVDSETPWQRAPGLVKPGEKSVLQPDLKGKSVIGTHPALKIKRPRI